MKKNNKTLLVIIAVALIIILAGYFVFQHYKNQQRIEVLNNSTYSFLNCLVNCPVVISSVKGMIFDENCEKVCQTFLVIPEDLDLDGIEDYKKNLVLYSNEMQNCFNIHNETKDFLKYRQCLIDFVGKK